MPLRVIPVLDVKEDTPSMPLAAIVPTISHSRVFCTATPPTTPWDSCALARKRLDLAKCTSPIWMRLPEAPQCTSLSRPGGNGPLRLGRCWRA